MQPAQGAHLRGQRMIVLHEVEIDAGFGKILFAIGLGKNPRESPCFFVEIIFTSEISSDRTSMVMDALSPGERANCAFSNRENRHRRRKAAYAGARRICIDVEAE